MKSFCILSLIVVALNCWLTPACATTYYVAQTHHSASDSNDGSSASPFKTISKAAQIAKAGDTVMVRRGLYRESISPANEGESWKRPISFVAQPGEEVAIYGSENVTDWELVPGTQVWKKTGWNISPQMIVVDQVLPLQQLGESGFSISYDSNRVLLNPPGGLDKLYPGSFWYDAPNKALYVRLPWNRPISWHSLEVATKDHIFKVGKYVCIKGFKMRYCNQSRDGSMGGMVNLLGNNVLEDCDIAWGDFAGVLAIGPVVMRRNKINWCGNSGIHMTRINYGVLEDNETSYNNWRNFDLGWHHGGMKVTAASNVKVRNHFAAGNRASGIWFDIDCDNITIENCTLVNNLGVSIHYELSKNAVIRNNAIFDSPSAGIWISASSGCKVTNNTCVNTLFGIWVNGVPRDGGYCLKNNAVKRNIFMGWSKATASVMLDDKKLVENNICDDNIYIGEQADSTKFYTNFDDYITGMAAWQKKTGKDLHSRFVSPDSIETKGGKSSCYSGIPGYGARINRAQEAYIQSHR